MATPVSKNIITIANNAVTAKLIDPDRDTKLVVQSILSYAVSGCEHATAFKQGRWDGRSSFLDFKLGTFPAGFVHLVTAHLQRRGFQVRRVQKPLPAPLGVVNPVVDKFSEDPRYDYQRDTVAKLLKHGQIIAQVATGGGKSRIAKIAFARINRPTLFLTTRSILMYQMKKSFEQDLGIEVGVLGDGQFGKVIKSADGSEQRVIKKMNVGMVQTLVSRLAEPCPDDDVEVRNHQAAIRHQTINLLSKFEFIVLEEAHEAAGNGYYEILRHCKNAHYRLALTATPFMKDDEEANMRLMASSGPIGIKITEKLLIDRGILARPYFKTILLKNRPKNLYRSTPWQSAVRLGIVDNEERNAVILAECSRATRVGLSVMLLVQQVAHGRNLKDQLDAAGVRCALIMGENDQKEREIAIGQLKDGKIDVLIGSTILDVGVDVPAVGMIILAGGGKAEVAMRQRIGRGLRAKKNGPNVALIVDFDDPFNNHLKKHALQRQAYIAETEGFNENILAPGADFDMIALGIVKKAA